MEHGHRHRRGRVEPGRRRGVGSESQLSMGSRGRSPAVGEEWEADPGHPWGIEGKARPSARCGRRIPAIGMEREGGSRISNVGKEQGGGADLATSAAHAGRRGARGQRAAPQLRPPAAMGEPGQRAVLLQGPPAAKGARGRRRRMELESSGGLVGDTGQQTPTREGTGEEEEDRHNRR